MTIFGMAQSPTAAKSHPLWATWVVHRNTRSWPFDETTDPQRSPSDLASIDCPVLLVKGSDSTAYDRAIVDSLGQYLPNASVFELQGGHASHIESFDAFIQLFTTHI